MKHDLIVRNGLVVDGTGAPPFEADLAVDGDTVTAIGRIPGTGRDEIDARGKTVTPGFVDLHTHLDAQIGWDSDLTSITWHGVTTALLGNCGVTFAPCAAGDREFLAGMMETVEDIPRSAILAGLPWDWETYGEYLDSIERRQPMVNVGGLAGHSAIRYMVMRERSIDEQPTADELDRICQIAADSIRGGAFGFSTNRHPHHRLPDGRCIPGTFAEAGEVEAIAKSVGLVGGIMQLVVDYSLGFDAEMGLVTRAAELSRGVLFNIGASPKRGFTELVDARVRESGAPMLGMTVPRAGGNLVGLSTPHLTNGRLRTESWLALKAMDFEHRLAAIRDAAFRGRLVDELRQHPKAAEVEQLFSYWYPLGLADRPNYTAPEADSLLGLARQTGLHPAQVMLDLMLETEGRMVFHHREFNRDLDGLAQLLQLDWVLPGMGDAGAHVGQMVDASWPTFVLGHWYRDMRLYSMEEAVRRISGLPAAFLGLDDRGTLEVGKRADINVVDLDRVAERQPQVVNDFPGGAARFIQRAVGYAATICNGVVVLRDDEHTGAHAGRVLRSGTR